MHVLVTLACAVAKLRLTLCDPVDCGPPGSSVHGILQARTLEWVALLQEIFPTYRSNSGLLLRGGRFFTTEPPWKPIHTWGHFKNTEGVFPHGREGKQPPVNAGDTGSIPGPGGSRRLRGSHAQAPPLLSTRAVAPKAQVPAACVLQQENHRGEKLVHCREEQHPLAATGESPHQQGRLKATNTNLQQQKTQSRKTASESTLLIYVFLFHPYASWASSYPVLYQHAS